MSFLHFIAHTLQNSFYNPAFYTNVTTWRLRKTVHYLFWLCLIYEVIFVFVIVLTVLPEIKKISLIDIIEQNYPAGLVITIKDGIASTNVTEPYMVAIPEDQREVLNPSNEDSSPENFKNLLIIDTKREISVGEIGSLDAMVILTNNALVVKKSQGETQILPLKEFGDMVVSKDTVLTLASQLIDILKVVAGPITVAAIVLFAPLMVSSYLFRVLFGALFTMAIGRIRGRKLTYGQSFKVSVVALGPFIMIGYLELALGATLLVPILTFILYLVLIWANLGIVSAPKPASASH